MVHNLKNFWRKNFDFFCLTRPLNSIMVGMAILLGALLVYKDQVWPLGLVVLGSVSLGLLAAWGNVHNDILDIETDKISHPERPLARESLSLAAAHHGAKLLIVFSSLFAFLLPLELMILWAFMLILLYTYNIYLKNLPLVGNIAVALLCALPVTFTNWNPLPTLSLLPALLAFVTHLLRELLKDLEDLEGDKHVHRKTFPLKYGLPATLYITYSLSSFLSLFLITTGIALYLKPSSIQASSQGVLIYLAFSALPSLYLCALIFHHQKSKNWHKAQQACKQLLYAGLAGFFILALL